MFDYSGPPVPIVTSLAARYAIGMAAMVIAFCGCYAYVPAELDTVPVGDDIRLYVTPERMSELRDVYDEGLPASGLPVVAGTLVRLDDAALAVRIPVFNQQVGFLETQIGRQVTVPLSDVVQIERRRFDRLRTALLLAVGSAASAAVMFEILGESRRPEEPTPLPDGDSRVPLFFIRIR